MDFFIPTWMINIVFLVTVYISGFQHVQLKRPNPLTNIQFVMMAFSLLMMVITALYNRTNHWLSLGFAVTSVICLLVMIRQMRMLPPLRSFE
jgi:hypothetical protein